ncbi:MAG: hypothetical protein U0169_17275 [Polyangiaceae bacterium]
MMHPRRPFAALALVAFPALVACSSSGSSGGKGTASFATFGEEYIEDRLPADVFADGWSVKYERFLVVIGEVKVADAKGTVGGEQKTPKLFDMKKPAGDKPVVSFPDLEAKAWEKVSYAIVPATSAVELGSATEDDKTLMVQGGYSLYVQGTATKDATTKTFTWGFKTNTLYDDCEATEDGKTTKGIVVTSGGTANVQLTIHGDHLYYDDLQSKDAKVRFDNIAAADANSDGNVTEEELAAVKLIDLKPANGPYGTGSAAGINDLRTYVEALSRTVGHFQGEGECFAKAR